MADEFSVQGGVFKNKKIPILESSKGHSNFTTSIMKKAIFSMIDSHVMSGNLLLEEAFFIDLFSGSGQMALEALSRGFNKVHLSRLAEYNVNYPLFFFPGSYVCNHIQRFTELRKSDVGQLHIIDSGLLFTGI